MKRSSFIVAVAALVVVSCVNGSGQTTATQDVPIATTTVTSMVNLTPLTEYSAATRLSSGEAVLFGGFSVSGAPVADTWRFDGAGWRFVDAVMSPSARGFHTVTFVDSLDGALVVGGSTSDRGFQCTLGNCLSSTFVDDPWLYLMESESWERVQPQGGPGPLFGHTATYAGANDTVVLFGGVAPPGGDGRGVLSAETWLLDPSTLLWSLVETDVSPPARAFHQAALDEGAQSVYVWGGYIGGRSNDPDMWRFDLDTQTWHHIEAPEDAPDGRWMHAMDFHNTSASVIMAGGLWYDNGQLTAGSDTWTYDLESNIWTRRGDHPTTLVGAARWESPDGMTIHEDGRTSEFGVAGQGWRVIVDIDG